MDVSKGGRSRLLVKWVGLGLGGLLLFLLFLRAGVGWGFMGGRRNDADG